MRERNNTTNQLGFIYALDRSLAKHGKRIHHHVVLHLLLLLSFALASKDSKRTQNSNLAYPIRSPLRHIYRGEGKPSNPLPNPSQNRVKLRFPYAPIDRPYNTIDRFANVAERSRFPLLIASDRSHGERSRTKPIDRFYCLQNLAQVQIFQ